MANSPAASQTLGWRVQPVGLTAKPIRHHQTQGVETSPLFTDIPPSDQAKIVSAAISRKFVRRQTIFIAGDPVKEILLLTEGCVKITQLGENGSEIILRLHGPGELLGASAVERTGGHGSTAEALLGCKALVWNASTFETLSEKFPTLQRNAMRILTRRLLELEGRLFEISTERVAPRLARELVRLLVHVGRRVDGVIEVHLSREELAQLTGTTLFTVSRVLSGWEQQGIVNLRRQAVAVQSPFGLLGVCDLK
jgi:CRP/FNR family transcriptional regulator, nitrogen oxide reductase regulator